MSEKGGKGFSAQDKASFLKGKDDSATKSAKGRKVQFSSEVGKADKVASWGRSSASKQQAQELRIDQELPNNAQWLMDCEAADILQGIQDVMVTLSKDPAIKLPVSFDRGLQYAKSTTGYTNSQFVREALNSLKNHGVSDGEICVIANVCPETVDEVFALIPSLKGKKTLLSEPLRDALYEIAKYKQAT